MSDREFDVIDIEVCVCSVHGSQDEHVLAAVDVVGVHLAPCSPSIIQRDASGHIEIGADLGPRAGCEVPGV